MLEAVDLTKSFGEIEALRGASLQVEAGQIVSLLGRNGAGKTTMLSIIAGLLRPDGGSVLIDGIDALADIERAARSMGIAPQETGIYGVLTVRQNLEFFGELSGLDRATRSRRAGEVAERLGLGPLLDRRAGKLSGGEARRLHTACALVHSPRLLMLDEPTVGADVATRMQLIDAVRDLAADGAAVVYTTHYLPEVTALDADLVIIDEGQVLATGSQADLIERYRIEGVQFEVAGPLPAEVAASAERLDGNGNGDTTSQAGGIGGIGDVGNVGNVGNVGDIGGAGASTAISRWRILGEIDLPKLLDRFGDQASRLRSVESLTPDLESVFLAVTGTRLDDEAHDPGAEPAGAST